MCDTELYVCVYVLLEPFGRICNPSVCSCGGECVFKACCVPGRAFCMGAHNFDCSLINRCHISAGYTRM